MSGEREYTIDKRNMTDKIYKIILIMMVGVVLVLYVWLYNVSKNNLINLQYGEVQSLNKDITYILENRRQKIAEDAMILEKYMAEGKTNQEVLTYLQMEYNVMSTLDPEYSDIYGYIRGEYLDGSNWTPGDDFIPKERPWYLAGLESNGETALASPYIDAISGNLIISYSRLLSDGESVISYDVQLSNMQKLVDETVNEKCLETLIFDENEIILADSQNDNISYYFGDLTDNYYHVLYEKYVENPNSNFEFSYGNDRFYVFNNSITDGMKQLMLVDARLMFSSLKKAIFYGLVILVIVIVLVISITKDINSRRKIAEEDLTKIRKLYFEANTDKLTGLYNRRAYEDKLNKINDEKVPENLAVFSFDLNGLKQVNDSLGHVEGDNLLCGAASVIKTVWGKYGEVYRIGGDEFSAILQIEKDDVDSLKSAFSKEMQAWNKKNRVVLSISYGLAIRCEHMDKSVHDMVEYADAEMYKEKTKYYKAAGVDRRRE